MLNNDLSAKKDSKKGDYGDGRGGRRLISFVICIAISEHHNVFSLLKQIREGFQKKRKNCALLTNQGGGSKKRNKDIPLFWKSFFFSEHVESF